GDAELGARGLVAFAAILVAGAIVTRLSPSYVPTLDRLVRLGGLAIAIAIALQLAATWRASLAAWTGRALVGLTIALASVGLVRTWFAPPLYDVPPPLWLVAVPLVELAAATTAAAIAICFPFALARGRSRPP